MQNIIKLTTKAVAMDIVYFPVPCTEHRFPRGWENLGEFQAGNYKTT